MFTGIVQATGSVAQATARRLGISSPLGPLEVGESVAVNGVCLTVVSWDASSFGAEISEQTARRTSLGSLAVGETVNLERAMRADGRFGGHIVQGHVDGVGTVAGFQSLEGSVEMSFTIPPGLHRYLVEKGSVTVDGVSLTVAALGETTFSAALVPHTLASTTLGAKQVGAPVNVEVDILAKYVERLLGARN